MTTIAEECDSKDDECSSLLQNVPRLAFVCHSGGFLGEFECTLLIVGVCIQYYSIFVGEHESGTI